MRPGGQDLVRELLKDLSGLQRSVGFRIPAAQLSCVTGIGSHLWGRLFAGPRPARLHPFRQWKGPTHTAPPTPGDLLPEPMLRRMFLGEPYGNHDRILDFSTARTGSLFDVPTGDFLDDLPPAPSTGDSSPMTPLWSNGISATCPDSGSISPPTKLAFGRWRPSARPPRRR